MDWRKKDPFQFWKLLALSLQSYRTLTIKIKTFFNILHTCSRMPGLISSKLHIIVEIDKTKLPFVFFLYFWFVVAELQDLIIVILIKFFTGCTITLFVWIDLMETEHNCLNWEHNTLSDLRKFPICHSILMVLWPMDK